MGLLSLGESLLYMLLDLSYLLFLPSKKADIISWEKNRQRYPKLLGIKTKAKCLFNHYETVLCMTHSPLEEMTKSFSIIK